MSAVREIVPQETSLTVTTPNELLRLAVSQNADIDKLAKLLDLQERWEKNEARKAFVSAMSAFKANPPQIQKVKTVDFSSKGGNRVNYNYAPLDHVTKVLGEALSRHGLSFRWNVQQTDAQVSVTCVVQHSEGHTESVTLVSGLHNDERMNPIQRLGSTITYLERYTLLAATGMATQEQDDDGSNLTNGWLAERVEWFENCRNREELDRQFKSAFAEAKEKNASKAMLALIHAKDKRKKELQ